MAYKTIVEDNIDVLVAGAGLGGTGAALKPGTGAKIRKLSLLKRRI